MIRWEPEEEQAADRKRKEMIRYCVVRTSTVFGKETTLRCYRSREEAEEGCRRFSFLTARDNERYGYSYAVVAKGR